MSARSRFLRLTLATALLVGCGDDKGPDPDASADAGPDAPMMDTGPVVDLVQGPPVSVTIASYNVENLFDATDDPQTFDETPTAGEVDSKLAAVGAAIRALDADIVALQEVENIAILQRLVTEELSSEGYTQVHLLEGNDPRGIDVALLSRFPVVTVKTHANDWFTGIDGDTQDYKFSRDCLEVVVEPSMNRRLTLLVNHLRAKNFSNPTESQNKRKAEATRVREIVSNILQFFPDANIAIIGDLNDTPSSQTLGILRDGTPAFVDVLDGKPAADRITIDFGEQFDYILLSPGLAADPRAGADVKKGGVFEGVSDHYPVVVELTLE